MRKRMGAVRAAATPLRADTGAERCRGTRQTRVAGAGRRVGPPVHAGCSAALLHNNMFCSPVLTFFLLFYVYQAVRLAQTADTQARVLPLTLDVSGSATAL